MPIIVVIYKFFLPSFLVEYVIAIERHFYLTVSVYFITHFMKIVNLVKINGLLKISCVNFGQKKKKIVLFGTLLIFEC